MQSNENTWPFGSGELKTKTIINCENLILQNNDFHNIVYIL